MKAPKGLEWDERKRQWTLAQRGLGFADLVGLDWETAEDRPDLRRDYGEPRRRVRGGLNGRLLVIILVERGERYRIISMRKANPREEDEYGRS